MQRDGTGMRSFYSRWNARGRYLFVAVGKASSGNGGQAAKSRSLAALRPAFRLPPA